MAEQDQGWLWIQTSMLRHYFAGGRSLCGKWPLPDKGEQRGDLDDDGSRYNCISCGRSLIKRRLASKRAQRGQSDEP